MNDHRYTKIVMYWKGKNSEVRHTVYNKTIAEAREIAEYFGYKKPKWYFPWQYLTGGLFIITVDKPNQVIV